MPLVMLILVDFFLNMRSFPPYNFIIYLILRLWKSEIRLYNGDLILLKSVLIIYGHTFFNPWVIVFFIIFKFTLIYD